MWAYEMNGPPTVHMHFFITQCIFWHCRFRYSLLHTELSLALELANDNSRIGRRKKDSALRLS